MPKIGRYSNKKKMFGKYDIDEGSEEWKQIYADGDGTIFTPKALYIYNTWYKYYFDILSSEIID